jgi:hypothetical protein
MRIDTDALNGRQRPLAIAALEDKIVQRATGAVLNAIYEEDFLGFSYGFPPRARHARRAGCAHRRDREHKGELGRSILVVLIYQRFLAVGVFPISAGM